MFRPRLSSIVIGALLVSNIVINTSPVQAAPSDGRIDTSFGTSGFTTTSIGDDGLSHSIAVDSQGRIIAGGYAFFGGVIKFTIARYTANGILDTSFGTAGLNTTTPGTEGDEMFSIALDSQDRVIAGGYVTIGGANKFAVARYTSSGVLDTTFGTAGFNTSTTGTSDFIQTIAIDSQGRIIAGGFATIGGASKFAVARYTSSGILDTTFGTAGFTTTTIGAHSAIAIIAFDSQGRIIAGGSADIGGAQKFAVARYTSSGVLDTTFGTAGFNTTSLGTVGEEIISIALDSQERIIAGGQAIIEGRCRFILARYTSSGILDTSFGTSGFTTTTPGTFDAISDIVLDSQERIIAGGLASDAGPSKFVLARYTRSGVLDSTFGTSGFITTTLDNPGSNIRSIALDSQGRVIAGGRVSRGGIESKFAIARYLLTANPDPEAIAAQAAANAYAYEAAAAAEANRVLMIKLLHATVNTAASYSELALVLLKKLDSAKCVKGKTTKYVKSGTKCPTGYVKSR